MGYPSRSFFCDNGPEFKGGLLAEISKKTGVTIKLTPSYSPWSNGSIERKHSTIDLTIKKMMADNHKLTLEDTLQHAVWAKNMEIGRSGHSPFQLVYGRFPHIPGISVEVS